MEKTFLNIIHHHLSQVPNGSIFAIFSSPWSRSLVVKSNESQYFHELVSSHCFSKNSPTVVSIPKTMKRVISTFDYTTNNAEPDERVKFRGGVEDTRLEAKAKSTNKILGQGQPFRGQTLSRPRTQPQVFSKKKIFKKVFLAISNL